MACLGVGSVTDTVTTFSITEGATVANENEVRATALSTRSVASERGWYCEAMEVPWVESPFFETLLEQSDLDDEQRRLARHYSAQGYVVIDAEIPDAMIDGVITGLQGEYGTLRSAYDTRIMDADLPKVREIAGWPKVIELLRMLYRREPFPFQTLNFEVGTEQHVHNDAIHFHAIPHRFMCGVWVALEDIDAENGPLFYYPGSHKLPIYEMPDFGLPASTESYDEWGRAVEALLVAGGFELQELHVKRGQALVWAANLHHGGRPILDNTRTRLSQVSHYYFKPALYYSPQGTDLIKGRLQLRDVCDLRTGEMVPHYYRNELIHRPSEPGGTVLQLRSDASRTGRHVFQDRWSRLRRRQ
jgi:hypothetical protein